MNRRRRLAPPSELEIDIAKSPGEMCFGRIPTVAKQNAMVVVAEL